MGAQSSMLKSLSARLMMAAALITYGSNHVSAQEIALDGIVVTATKTEESWIDAAAGSSVVERDTIEEQFNPDRISEVLRTIPGVTTQETGRDTATAINIRGLQDFGRVNVLIDGARQNFQRSGHSANGVFYIEPEMIKRVDITRGPTATIYGSGAIGGVAAFETINADDILRDGEYAAVRSRTSYGSNGNEKLASGTTAVKVGNFDILGQFTARDSGNYEDGDGNDVTNSADDAKSKLIKARWRPAAGHEITGTVIDLNSDFVDQLGAVERDTEVENRQYTLGYTWRSDNPLIDFSAKIYRNETDLGQTRLTPSAFEPAGAERSFNVETEGFDVFNTSRFDFGAVKWALTYGGDAFRDRVNTDDFFGNGDEFTPSGERTVYGAFAQSTLSFFDTVDVITALRYDNYELTGGTTVLEGDHVSPKVTVAVTPIEGFTVFGTWAEGFRAPAVTETLIRGFHPPPAPFPLYPNPNLKPEVAENIEAGVNLKYSGVLTAGDVFRAKAVVFRNDVEDYIGQVTVMDGSPPFGFGIQYQNIANATLDGVELEAVYDAQSWFVQVGAHHIRGKDEDANEPLVSVPADQVTLTAGFRAYDERLVAGGRARFVAKQDRVPSTSTVLATDAYTVVDLFAQYEATDNVTLNLNIDNLFDETYMQYLDAQNSPGFSARAGLTLRFGAAH